MNSPMDPALKLSVIVPAYESHATARAMLESLRQQTFHDFETILVDSGLTDAVAQLVTDFPEVRYHRSIRHLLPHEGRNVGAQMAKNDLLVFTDPDVVAAPDWLEKLVSAYRRAGSPIAGAVASLQPDWLETGIHLSKFDLWLPGGPERTVPIGASVNFLCEKALLRQVGGFDGDEMIGDTVLSWDLIALGKSLRFAPDAIVYHDHRASLKQLLRERFVRGADFGRLRSEREEWSAGRTITMATVSIVPLRLTKLVWRSVRSTIRSRCFLAGIRTLPIVLAAHAAWLAGETTEFWKRLQLRSAAPEPNEACM
jgi:glycosyltransferase involved in cell wall biosynthesis